MRHNLTMFQLIAVLIKIFKCIFSLFPFCSKIRKDLVTLETVIFQKMVRDQKS